MATGPGGSERDMQPLQPLPEIDVFYVGTLTAAAFAITLATILLAGSDQLGNGELSSLTSLSCSKSSVRVRVSSPKHPALCTRTPRLHHLQLRSQRGTCCLRTYFMIPLLVRPLRFWLASRRGRGSQ